MILVLIIIGFYSCSSSSNDSVGTLTFSGKLINTTGIAVRNASIKLLSNGSVKYEFRSDSLGQFNFKNIELGAYTINITATGYSFFTAIDTLRANKNDLFTIKGEASIAGTIINSQTGGGLAHAIVRFRFDQQPTTGHPDGQIQPVDMEVVTDEYGNYSIQNAPTGHFTITIEASNYFSRQSEDVTFNSGDNTVSPMTLVSQPAEGEIRIILIWGRSPSDLDTHFTGPTDSGSRFHIYFSEKAATDVNLDVDDVSSYGPETLTIKKLVTGVYRYSVFNYSNQSNTGGLEIASSPARVEIYNHRGLVKKYIAPHFTGAGNTWRVFEMNCVGSNIELVPSNIYVTAESSRDVPNFSKNYDVVNSNTRKTPLKFNVTDF